MKKRVISPGTPSAKRGYKTFPCQVDGCGKAFTSSGLVNHMRTHTGEKPFECVEPGCGKAFAEAGSLVKHTRIHTGEKPYKCTEPGCEQAFSLPRSLANHILIHTGEKPFKCAEPGCSRAFTTSESLVYHARTHTGEKPFKCTEPDCNQAFTTSGGRVTHIRRIHTGEKPYKCAEPGCDKVFAASGNLLKHTRTHTGEKIYKCTEPGCEQAFTQSGSLVTHIRTHTGEKPFKCAEPGCLHAFTTSGDRVNHIRRIHTGEKPFKCAEPGCEQAFAVSGGLATHMRTHTGERPYKCTEPGCEQAFAQSAGLVAHMRTHTGEKPFKCLEPGCNTVYATSGNLSSHTLTHTGEKSFKCAEPGCNQTFARPGSLVEHRRIHTGEKPFKCLEPGCNTAFTHYGSLSVHVSRHYIPLLDALIADAFPSGRPIQCGLPMCVGPTCKLETTVPVILPSIVQVSCIDQCGIRGFCCHCKKREYCGFPQCGGGERVCPICSTRRYVPDDSYTIDGVRTCMTCFHTYFNARLGECTTTAQRLAILRKPSNRRIKEFRIAGDVVEAFGDRGWDFQGYTADCDDTLNDDEAELTGGETKGLGGFTRLKWYFTDMESIMGDGNTILVIEIDEHEHKQYPVTCEYNRMIGVVAAHRGKRVLFARFNPDEWNLNGQRIGSTFTKNADGIFEPNDLYQPRVDYFVQCVRELCSGSLLHLGDRDGLAGVMYVNYSTDSAAVAYSTEQLGDKNVCVKQMQ